MWYIMDNYGDGDIFAGLRAGVTREAFEHALHAGSVQQTVTASRSAPAIAFSSPAGASMPSAPAT